MLTQTKPYRYQLPKKAIKSDCPDCGHRHRKTLSRYVDSATDEVLPESYGRCDRESNCGYHLSPYHKGASGVSYADEQKQPPIPKAWFRMAGRQKRNGVSRHGFIQTLTTMEGATPEQAERVAAYIFDQPARKRPLQPAPVCSIPDEVFTQSLGHYDRNQFARLLRQHFGFGVADKLLQRFQIGTSSRWPGACVFWYIDEQDCKRGGQIKLFDETFHTVKYVDREGEKRTKTSWVHAAYKRRCDQQQQPYPAWLTAYLDERNHVQKSPCLFGLPQLLTAPVDQPIAIVEAPKTAVLCTPYFPDFVWLAVGALSYLNVERLAPLRGRNVALFPDLSKDGSAFARWNQSANALKSQGINVTISNYLEQRATDEQKVTGFDLADYLLDQWPGYPPEWDNKLHFRFSQII